jgi:hypothetical protein
MLSISKCFLSFGITVLLFTFGCDAWTKAQGTIRDPGGKPIQDAVITMKVGKDSRDFHSFEDGRFMVQMWQPPFKQDVTLTVTKPGYVSFEKQFKGPGTFKDFDIVLKPIRERPLDTPESIAKAMFPDALDNTHDIQCFRSLTFKMSINEVVQKCGRPDGEFGSGILRRMCRS